MQGSQGKPREWQDTVFGPAGSQPPSPCREFVAPKAINALIDRCANVGSVFLHARQLEARIRSETEAYLGAMRNQPADFNQLRFITHLKQYLNSDLRFDNLDQVKEYAGTIEVGNDVPWFLALMQSLWHIQHDRPPVTRNSAFTNRVAVLVSLFNETRFAELCLKSIRRFAGFPHYTVVVNNSTVDMSAFKDTALQSGWVDDWFDSGCTHHGQGLQRGLHRVSDFRYVAAVDSDAVGVRADWLKDLVQELNRSNAGLIGMARDSAARRILGYVIHPCCMVVDRQRIGSDFQIDFRSQWPFWDVGGLLTWDCMAHGIPIAKVAGVRIGSEALHSTLINGAVRHYWFVSRVSTLDDGAVLDGFRVSEIKRKLDRDYAAPELDAIKACEVGAEQMPATPRKDDRKGFRHAEVQRRSTDSRTGRFAGREVAGSTDAVRVEGDERQQRIGSSGSWTPKVCLYCARFPSESFQVASLGLGYIASFLRAQGVVGPDEIRIVDTLEEAIEFQPDILGVGSVSQVIKHAQRFARQCKDATGCLTVLGGYHVSCIPQQLPREFDLGVIGEGEETFAEIVAAFGPSGLDARRIGQINGLCYRADDVVAQTPARAMISDIDRLPWPYRHRSYSREEPVFTSRGCPYRCTFCASHTFWKNSVRFRSAASVVDEIAYLVDVYAPEEITILDDLWMAHKRRFRQIVRGLVERGIPEKVTFNGFCRSNLVHEEDIQLFKEMNYHFVRFGAETASPDLLRRIKGAGISVADHQRVIDLCAKHSIPCGASFMFGVPGETRRDVDLTIQFLRKNKGKCRIRGLYLCNPIPGTQLWRELREKGKVTDQLDFGQLQLDLLKPGFSWDDLLYFNEHNIPLHEFRRIIEGIKQEFIGSSTQRQGGSSMPQAKLTQLVSTRKVPDCLHLNARPACRGSGSPLTAPPVIAGSGRSLPARRDWGLDSGERQTGARLEDIRRDHLNRYQLVADIIKNHVAGRDRIKVLDVFCGNGYGSNLLARQLDNILVDAIDGSAEAVAFAQRNFASERITYHHGIFPFSRELPIDSVAYDYVVSLESIEHVEDDRRFYQFLLSRLRDNAVLCLSVPNKNRIDLSRNKNQFHFRHYDLQDVENLARHAGCPVDVIDCYGQDVYAVKDRRIVGLLDESDMNLRQGYDGQFLVVVLRKGQSQRRVTPSVSLRLDVGCGSRQPRPGFVGVDIRSFPWVKYVCNAWEIGDHLERDSVAEIHSRHFLEHLTFAQADLTLQVWRRVLAPGGTLHLVVPDLDYHIRQFMSPDPETHSAANSKWTVRQHALAGFWGWQTDSLTETWDVHKSGYDYSCLEEKLLEHDFEDIVRVHDEPWNLHVICRKPT